MFMSLPLHPIIVHVPVTLIAISLLFELVGRALDSDWWRRAAFALLIVGALGAVAAVLTGGPAGDVAENRGVDEHAVDAHEAAADWALWLAVAAVVVRAVAGRTGKARAGVAGLALLLHVFAAAAVIKAGYRGGQLVYEHAAGVRVHGQPAPSDGPPRAAPEKP